MIQNEPYETCGSDSDNIWSIRTWWTRYAALILRVAIVLMGFAAMVWLGYEFYRLLRQPGQVGFYTVHPGAIDLKYRFEEVHGWFAGKPVYFIFNSGDYPPASYVMLWPFLGWMALTTAIGFWAATTVAALAWLTWIIVRESGANTTLERVFVALIPSSMYATGATIGNGQLIVHLLPVLLAGILLLDQDKCKWRTDLLVTGLVLMALMKPSVSAPFFWIVLFVPGRLRPALLVVSGYIALTLFAASFQEGTALALFREWIDSSTKSVSYYSGYNNLHNWLFVLGLERWNFAVSMVVLTALGAWVYRYRHSDIWILMGVTGLIARVWAYHRWYDDLLILLPMIALFRIIKKGSFSPDNDLVAGLLLGTSVMAMMAPGGLYLFPYPWNTYYTNIQMIVWISILIFLLITAQQGQKIKPSTLATSA